MKSYTNANSFYDKILRLIWKIFWNILIRPLPRDMFKQWIILIYRLFKAKIHKSANIYSSVRVYAPWNLEMHENSCIGPEVDCYNVDKVIIGRHSIVSQKSYLCTASHNISKSSFNLITKPIILGEQSWVGASSFIGMGVTVGEGAVVGATSSVYKDIEKWTVVGGNPAKFIKKRIID